MNVDDGGGGGGWQPLPLRLDVNKLQELGSVQSLAKTGWTVALNEQQYVYIYKVAKYSIFSAINGHIR